MMNTAGNNIAVLVPMSEAPAETEDERDTRLAMEGHGQKLIGTWQALSDSTADNANGKEIGDLTGDLDFGQYILQQNRYLRLDANGNVSRTKPTQKAETQKAEPKGFFAAIASALSGQSQAASSESNEELTQWIAVRQDGDVVQFALIESGVKNYVAAVRFIEADKAEFKWYYNEVSGEPMATSIYKKIANGEPETHCDSATCKGVACDKPNCEHTKPATAPRTTTETAVIEIEVKE